MAQGKPKNLQALAILSPIFSKLERFWLDGWFYLTRSNYHIKELDSHMDAGINDAIQGLPPLDETNSQSYIDWNTFFKNARYKGLRKTLEEREIFDLLNTFACSSIEYSFI